MLFYQKTPQEALDKLNTSAQGLSRHEAGERLKRYGLNEVRIKGDPLWRKLIEPFANIFMAVLLLAVIISLTHHAVFDAVIIVVIMLVSAGIYYVQRFSTERILRSLQKHNAQRVEVLRGNESVIIDAAHLVPGDIITLSEGDKIPADVRILQENALRLDESVLTGESVPVSKAAPALRGTKEVYEQANMLFQGSFIVAGGVTGVVTATGNNSEFGRIATLAGKEPSGGASSPVQKKVDKLVSYTIAIVFAVAIVAFILALSRGMAISDALRFVIALSVSAVPEGLPVAISVILVLGMRRMAAKKALVRTMRAIETVGVLTTIATDKTGTLTENKLSVQETWQPDWQKEPLNSVMFSATNSHAKVSRDPLDTALTHYAQLQKADTTKGHMVTELPFDQSFAMSGTLWKQTSGYTLAVKGAPEHIIGHSQLTPSQKAAAETALHHLTSQGYRVIAIATVALNKPIESFMQLGKKPHLSFIGLVAVADTLRPAAKRAIATAQHAGVTVRMITGDHFETAYSIGRKLGLVHTREEVFDSRKMNDMTNEELAIAAHRARIFSRVTPENKYRILEVLKLTEVTAMTGDGVNDVPALANAHVGVAMGSGSQIAKDAGDIILLNDNFASIVRAMREGRIIFANIRRMLFYLLSTNIGEVLTTVGALIIGLPMPLAPVQILWVNLVTDTTMVIPLGLEPGEKQVMQQRPISPKAPILGKYMISRIIIVAVMMAALSLGFYAYYGAQHGTAYGMTIAFVALVVVQWANAFNARSTLESAFTRVKTPSKAFWVGLTISIMLQIVAIFGPLQGILHVHPITIGDMVVVSAISFTVAIAVVELHKFFGRTFLKHTAINA